MTRLRRRPGRSGALRTRRRRTPVRSSPVNFAAAVIVFAQAAALLAWVVWRLSHQSPSCVDGGYCDVFSGPLVQQAPIASAVAAATAVVGYHLARGSVLGWLAALVGELLLGMGVLLTDIWGEEVVGSGYVLMSVFVTLALLVTHQALITVRRFLASGRD